MIELANNIDSWEGALLSYAPMYDEETGWHSWHVTHVVHIPSLYGLLVSDYVHQLRSSLDNLITSLATLNGVPVEHSHSFPMVARRQDWKGAVGSQLKGLRSDHIDEIASVQPFEVEYDPADHPLAALRRLSNRDKHEILTPTLASNAGIADIKVTKDGIAIAEVETSEGLPLKAGTDMLRVRTEPPDSDPGFVIEDHGPRVYISFGDPPINLESMNRIGACVHDVVERPVFRS